jgi:hypothetical protein
MKHHQLFAQFTREIAFSEADKPHILTSWVKIDLKESDFTKKGVVRHETIKSLQSALKSTRHDGSSLSFITI